VEVKGAVVDPDTLVTFTVALKQRNIDVLKRVLFEVSDPRHHNYGKHWSKDRILGLVSPVEAHRQTVRSWIVQVAESSKLTIVDRGDAYRVTTTVGVAERLFETKLHFFVDTSLPKALPVLKFIGKFSVPSSVSMYIDMITGITEFPPQPLQPKVYKATEGTNQCNTPYTLKRIYNMSLDIQVTTSSATVGPFSRDAHTTKTIGFGEGDLSTWQQLNDLPQDPVSAVIGDASYLYGPLDSSLAGGEALLDVQMITAFAPASNMSFWIVSDWMYEFAQEILSTPGAPLVNSMSYGWEETNQCDITDCNALGFPDSATYITRTDVEFMKDGVAGFTLLAAAGDNGVEPNRFCTFMYQDYPASSSYVTTVGATAVVKSDNEQPIGPDAPPICSDKHCECSTSMEEEGAMHDNAALFDTGGGFSHYNTRPSYQTYAVAQYLNSGVQFPASKYWNNTNRGYPDVAACGANVAVYQKGSVTQLAGTSASCPIWAGILTVLNSDRLAAHKAPLGFANPLLYQMWQDDPSTFNDITVGHNGGNHYVGSGACDKFNFYATNGWDAVSGLGTPNVGRIREYVARLP
jgi:tripeptidyl-peptidase-1